MLYFPVGVVSVPGLFHKPLDYRGRCVHAVSFPLGVLPRESFGGEPIFRPYGFREVLFKGCPETAKS